jgi:hypothetical protein
MTEIAYLATALVMGALLVAVALLIARRRLTQPPATRDGPDGRSARTVEALDRAIGSPGVWTGTFVLITIAIMGGVLAYVGGGPVPEASQQAAGLAVAGLALLVITTFVFFGTYYTARSKGRSTAMGVAEGATALGLLFIVAIVATLVVG